MTRKTSQLELEELLIFCSRNLNSGVVLLLDKDGAESTFHLKAELFDETLDEAFDTLRNDNFSSELGLFITVVWLLNLINFGFQ